MLTGRYWDKDKDQYGDFKGERAPANGRTDADLVHSLRNHEPVPEGGRTDADLIRNLRSHLLDDNSKDGLARDLFPLTSEEQKDYEFTLLGQEVESGHNVYRIAFVPKNKQEGHRRARRSSIRRNSSPLGRSPRCRGLSHFWCGRCGSICRELDSTLSGTKRIADGVWFPSVFGTEFRLHVGPMLFFNRDVSISLENSGNLNISRRRRSEGRNVGVESQFC